MAWTEAPRAGRVTAASTELDETEFFVALQYQDDEAELQVDEVNLQDGLLTISLSRTPDSKRKILEINSGKY